MQRPEFIKAFAGYNTLKTFPAAALDRSGEWVAWLLASSLGVLDAVQYSRLGSVSVAALIFTILFLLAASATSFSNWLERNTVITASENGLVYQRALQKIAIPWEEIDSLMLTRRGAGWYVMVAGDQKSFTFQTPTIIKGPLGREVRTGIEFGEQLAAMTARKANLPALALDCDVWVCRRE